jgi:hypothetical protein
MSLVKGNWLVILLTLFIGAGTGVAQNRIQLAQGKRPIQDKVTFVVDLAPDPRYAVAPEGIQILTRFTDRPATGRVYVDDKAVGRFDESMSFTSNTIGAKYGRHTITVAFATPALMLDFYVTVRGPGVAREILDDQEPVVAAPPNLEKRLDELERKIRDLEAEVATLKKKRNH